MKLSVTAYESEQLAVARQVIGELNANLAGRAAGFRFTVALASKNPDGDLDGHQVVTDATGNT